MQLKIQDTSLQLNLLNKASTAYVKVVFSFENTLLTAAKKLVQIETVETIDCLNSVGSISSLTLHNTHFIIVSLGAKKDFNQEKLNQGLASIATWIYNHKTKLAQLDIVLEDDLSTLLDITTNQYIENSIYRILSNLYYFDKFKTQKTIFKLSCINFVTATVDNDLLQNVLALIQGLFTIRDLGNLPANIANPTFIAQIAEEISNNSSKSSCKILEEEQLRAMNMNSFLAVAAGSDQNAKLITLDYNGTSNHTKPIILIGKGITFDSGGISIKPKQGMEQMKYDMLGAATVLGVFLSAVKLNLPINLKVIIPCCENMLSGKAVKPGDIVTSMSGKTIEILNTDAEGRLILCDALTYAQTFDPEVVIDVATLTGACVVALGSTASALYSNDEVLAKQLLKAGKNTHDLAWQMPLFNDYLTPLKSSIADLRNIGGWNQEAGSIVAAKFLEQFVSYKWAHLDIAGSAYASGTYKGDNQGGATGRPFNLLMNFLRNYH